MDKTGFLGQTIDSRLKDSHGRCEKLSPETLTLSCWLVSVINKSHNNADSVLFPGTALIFDLKCFQVTFGTLNVGYDTAYSFGKGLACCSKGCTTIGYIAAKCESLSARHVTVSPKGRIQDTLLHLHRMYAGEEIK